MTTEFLQWALKHGKEYKSFEEFDMRLQQFTQTHEEIMKIQAQNGTSTVGHNHFSDMTEEEFKNFTGFRPRDSITNVFTYAAELPTADLPAEINWVTKGGVNAVQDQGQCGSCWAFSAIASMEGNYFTQTGKLLKLSEQQCVDCDTDSFGCSGGW